MRLDTAYAIRVDACRSKSIRISTAADYLTALEAISNQQSIELDGDLSVNISSFQRHLKAENKSPATVRAYVEATKLFDEILSAGGHPRYLAERRAEHVELFISSQPDRHTAATAANRESPVIFQVGGGRSGFS